jgi:hypothetical protein
MKKYYIDNFNINILKNKCTSTYTENNILTYSGIIKIIKDQYVLHKLIEKPITIIENFINNNNAYIDNSYFKKDKIIFNIPLEHTFVNIEYKKYKLDKNICLVKEFINNNLVDYYFLANCDPDFFQIYLRSLIH